MRRQDMDELYEAMQQQLEEDNEDKEVTEQRKNEACLFPPLPPSR